MDALALAALTAALALPGARVELLGLDGAPPAGCAVESADVPRPVAASGRHAVRLAGATAAGARCDGWRWAEARVLAPALRTTRDLAAGERVDGAAEPVEREVRPGRAPLAALPAGATAARALRAGTILEDLHLRSGPLPGAAVAVLVRAGALAVEQPGRAVPCGRGRACALLPSGKRVEGVLDGGRLVVELP
jgi:hypothetical protein